MKSIRVFVFAALAVMVAFGLNGQAMAAEGSGPHFHVHVAPGVPTPAAGPDVSLVHQGITGMGVEPPLDGSGNDTWPCFTGGSDADCSSIAAGGLVIGVPLYTWSLTNCSSTTATCGQIFWSFETDVTSTSTPIKVSVTVKQGTSTILETGLVTVGTNPGAGFIEIISDDTSFGPAFCATPSSCVAPVAGPATISVETKIGTSVARGSATITLQ